MLRMIVDDAGSQLSPEQQDVLLRLSTCGCLRNQRPEHLQLLARVMAAVWKQMDFAQRSPFEAMAVQGQLRFAQLSSMATGAVHSLSA